jgi:hypothetical protein
MFAIVAMISIVSMVTVIIITVLIVVVTPVALLVTRNILAVVPVVLDKVDAFPAGIVFVAVLAPMFGMAGRHAQIDWWAIRWSAIDYNGLGVNHLRLRIVADVNLSIEAGLANTYGYADIARECRSNKAGRGGDYCGCD